MNEELYISVKKYLSNQLSKDEKHALEKSIEENPHIKNQVQLYAGMIEAISHKGDEELNNELMELGKSLLEKEQENSPLEAKVRKLHIPLYVYAIAAAIILLFIIVPFQTTKSPSELFVSNFEAPSYANVRDNDIPATRLDSLEASWKAAYEGGEYSYAVVYLNELLADSSFQGHSEAYYYLGISQLITEEPKAAIASFSHVGEGFEYQEEVVWYTALAWLKTGDISEARRRFQAIVDDPTFNQSNYQGVKEIYEKSKKILKELPKEG